MSQATPGGFGPTMGRWSVGIAHSTSPAGPWTKYQANPIINESIVGYDGFYVAAVLQVNGSIWMYAEAPIVANDYGPLALFTADRPEGPYTNRGPVLVGGEPGQWDHTQYSESKIVHKAFLLSLCPPTDHLSVSSLRACACFIHYVSHHTDYVCLSTPWL